jgi:hypothetical protein
VSFSANEHHSPFSSSNFHLVWRSFASLIICTFNQAKASLATVNTEPTLFQQGLLSIMKISIITTVFTATIVPFAAVSATIFKCGVKADFHGKDKTKNPTVPSKAILNWMSDDLKQTFATSYRTNGDMNMLSDTFSKFSMKREADPTVEIGDVMIADNSTSVSFLDGLVAKLRGGDDVSRGWYSWYWYYYRANTRITCNYVSAPWMNVGSVLSYPCVQHSLTLSCIHLYHSNSVDILTMITVLVKAPAT